MQSCFGNTHHHHHNMFEKDYSVANDMLIKELSFERRGRQRRENFKVEEKNRKKKEKKN